MPVRPASTQPLHQIEDAYRAAKIYVLCEAGMADGIVIDLGYTFGRSNLRQFDDFDELVTEAMDFRPEAIVCDVECVSKSLLVNIRRLRNDDETADIAVVCRVRTLTAYDMGQLLSAGASGVLVSTAPAAEFIGRLTQYMSGAEGQDIPRSGSFGDLWAAQVAQNRALMPDEALIGRFGKQYALDIDVIFQPQDSIGGDMWGLIPIDQSQLAVFMADFCGHGWRVAPNAIRLANLLRSRDIDRDQPAAVLSWLNQRLRALLPRGQFAAMIYGVIDLRHDTFRYSCGSWMPFAVQHDAGAGWTPCEGRGLPLGTFADVTYEAGTVGFGPGGGLVLYSDALVETPGVPNNILTSDRVVEGLNRLGPKAAPADINRELAYRLGLRRGRLSDDLTVLSMRRHAS